VTTFADRPGYERTSSSLWKQREEYCASLIQKAWKVHKTRASGASTSKADEPVTSEDEGGLSEAGGPANNNSKHLIEVKSLAQT
jgi:voltage-gated sodium channel type II alpha